MRAIQSRPAPKILVMLRTSYFADYFEARNTSAKELAEHSGLEYPQLLRCINGKEVPTMTHIEALALELKVDALEFVDAYVRTELPQTEHQAQLTQEATIKRIS